MKTPNPPNQRQPDQPLEEEFWELFDDMKRTNARARKRKTMADKILLLEEKCEKLYEDNQAQAKRIEELEEALRDVEWDMKQMWITLEEWIDEECKEKNGHYRVAGYKDNPFGRCVHVQDYVKQALSSTHFPPEKE